MKSVEVRWPHNSLKHKVIFETVSLRFANKALLSFNCLMIQLPSLRPSKHSIPWPAFVSAALCHVTRNSSKLATYGHVPDLLRRFGSSSSSSIHRCSTLGGASSALQSFLWLDVRCRDQRHRFCLARSIYERNHHLLLFAVGEDSTTA